MLGYDAKTGSVTMRVSEPFIPKKPEKPEGEEEGEEEEEDDEESRSLIETNIGELSNVRIIERKS